MRAYRRPGNGCRRLRVDIDDAIFVRYDGDSGVQSREPMTQQTRVWRDMMNS